jgi:GntR family transcriptional regulator of arabinose operon
MGTQKPKYMEVADWVLSQIENGTFQEGDRLPSEHQLCLQFQLNRQTIRHAIDGLEQKNMLTRIQGSGTYVGANGRTERQKRYYNIAVVSTYVDSYIFPAVLKGIERTLSKSGYTMQVAFTGNHVEREGEILKKIVEKGMIDGLIAEPAKSAIPNPNLHFYQQLSKQGIPVLFINSRYQELDIPYVSLHDDMVGEKAAEYLIRAGHKKLGALFKCDDGQGHLRYTGFIRALEKAGLQADGRNIMWMDSESQMDMEVWADYLFQRLQGCTGLVCYNDEVAYRFTAICKDRGIKIPDDISIVGIDNSELSVIGDVAITSFPHPMESLGKKAAKNIIKLIENPCFEASYLFDSEVVERSSVKVLKQDII